MKNNRTGNAERTLLGRSGWAVTLMLFLLAAAPSAFGLWLPWATEQDKVAKALSDVWQALVVNDKAILAQCLTGAAPELFVKHEQELISIQGITKYDCRIKKIEIDPGTGTFAFVEYDRIATIPGKEQVVSAAVSVLQKLHDQWKLVTGTKSKRKAAEKKERRKASPSDGGAGAASAVDGLPAASPMPGSR
jgi:ribosomal protein L10